jgi:hypothetical protein
MERRVPELRAQHPDDETAMEIATEAEKKIEIHRQFSGYCSYGFFILRPTAR